MRFTTPLRYPGGKSKLANFMKLVIEVNGLTGGHYAEPYAGGAGIAFHLLFNDYVSHVHINDLNLSVHAFWSSVLEYPDDICRLIYDTPVSMTTWHEQKYIQKNQKDFSLVQLGFSTFFLNRTNRSGIIEGGVIGGKNQNGKWALDARYNKIELISRIEKISRHKDKISIYNQDAALFITNRLSELPKKSLIYLDPPYYVKGRGLYQNHYQHDDHVMISNLVPKIKQKWIVSYDDTPEIREMYKDFRHLPYKLSYSAADRYKGSEIMFFCDKLSIPAIENPAKLRSSYVNLRLF